MWDYYAEFMVPCLEAFGTRQTPIVSRDEWIETYPKVHWGLTFPVAEADMDRAIEVCPFGPIA